MGFRIDFLVCVLICLIVANVWFSGKEYACQWRRLGFDPWVRKIFWRRKWQPTPVFLPGKSHGQRSLVGYSPWGRKESDTNERLHFLVYSYEHPFLPYLHTNIELFVVQLLSRVWLFATPRTAALQASQSFTISQSLPKLMSIKSAMPLNYFILCCSFLLLPSLFPSIRSFPMSWLFASGGQSIGASVSAIILPMNIQGWLILGLTGLISFL